MFAFTKTAKTKKLLLSHVEFSANLVKRLNNEVLDDPELEQLRKEKLEIELERQALLYDNLKTTYPDFTFLTSEKDWWRVEKPKLSEGSVFTSKYCPGFSVSSNFYIHLRPSLLESSDATTVKASQTYNKSLLHRALSKKTINKKLNKLDQKFKTGILPRTDQITLACILEHPGDRTITLLDHINIPNSILEPFAKETKINFVKELT